MKTQKMVWEIMILMGCTRIYHQFFTLAVFQLWNAGIPAIEHRDFIVFSRPKQIVSIVFDAVNINLSSVFQLNHLPKKLFNLACSLLPLLLSLSGGNLDALRKREEEDSAAHTVAARRRRLRDDAAALLCQLRCQR
jgi:hypothetical protein